MKKKNFVQQPITINVHNFYEQFKKEYEKIYETHGYIDGYTEAVKAFDEFLANHREFVGEFVKVRGDFISSDREAAAFMFALNEMI